VTVRLGIAALLIAIAWIVGKHLDRRLASKAQPTERTSVPAQLERADFPRPEAAWLVVLFSSKSCGGCAEMSEKLAVLATDEVAVCDVGYETQRELQERYSVDTVPLLVVADAEGVVRAHALGNVPASDMWAAVARARGRG